MRALIVGVGAIGGVVAARLLASGASVSLATRTPESANTLTLSGLAVTGIGGHVSTAVADVAPVTDYIGGQPFDLIVLATKAQEAIQVAPTLAAMLGEQGTLLPVQNGGVAQLLSERLGPRVLGGLSNLGATMTSPGHYEQRNAGHLLIGELRPGTSDRVEHIQRWLSQGVEIRTTANMSGAMWSKLVVNCAVTTIGAIAATTMRRYIRIPEGRTLFDRAYDEALSVALASRSRPEPMLVNPIPPGWSGRSVPSRGHAAWLEQLLAAYGDLKPSMLQDFERGRTTEIEFINGYVARLGQKFGVPTPANDALVAMVRKITDREVKPGPILLRLITDQL